MERTSNGDDLEMLTKPERLLAAQKARRRHYYRVDKRLVWAGCAVLLLLVAVVAFSVFRYVNRSSTPQTSENYALKPPTNENNQQEAASPFNKQVCCECEIHDDMLRGPESAMEFQFKLELPSKSDWKNRESFIGSFQNRLDNIEKKLAFWSIDEESRGNSIEKTVIFTLVEPVKYTPEAEVRFRRGIWGDKQGENDVALKVTSKMQSAVFNTPVEPIEKYAVQSRAKLEGNYSYKKKRKGEVDLEVKWQRTAAIDDLYSVEDSTDQPSFSTVEDVMQLFPRANTVFGTGVDTTARVHQARRPHCKYDAVYIVRINDIATNGTLSLKYENCKDVFDKDVVPSTAEFAFKFKLANFEGRNFLTSIEMVEDLAVMAIAD